ncbi:MAG TPA: hypothetical protein VJM51_00345 [Dehalococcoidia bacterium]|nr:hypothetical protein [Dehalococcoidia bacterium]
MLGLLNLSYANVIPPPGEPLIFDVEVGPVPQYGTFVGLTFGAFKHDGQWDIWVPGLEDPTIPETDVRSAGIFNSREAFERWASILGHPTVYLGPATTPADRLIPALEAARRWFRLRNGLPKVALLGGLAIGGVVLVARKSRR